MGSFWKEVVCELCGEVSGSDLYDNASSLNACIVGEGKWTQTPLQHSKWSISQGGEIDRFEYPTLARLWQHAQIEPNSYFLYIHTKGVRDEYGRRFRASWRRIMSHRLIARWRDCVSKFDDGFQTVGSLYSSVPFPHYAGNFWWAHGSHLSTLPMPAPIEEGINKRVWAEMWLMHKMPRPVVYCWGTPPDIRKHYISRAYRNNPIGWGFKASSMGNPSNYPWINDESQITNAVR